MFVVDGLATEQYINTGEPFHHDFYFWSIAENLVISVHGWFGNEDENRNRIDYELLPQK